MVGPVLALLDVPHVAISAVVAVAVDHVSGATDQRPPQAGGRPLLTVALVVRAAEARAGAPLAFVAVPMATKESGPAQERVRAATGIATGVVCTRLPLHPPASKRALAGAIAPTVGAAQVDVLAIPRGAAGQAVAAARADMPATGGREPRPEAGAPGATVPQTAPPVGEVQVPKTAGAAIPVPAASPVIGVRRTSRPAPQPVTAQTGVCHPAIRLEGTPAGVEDVVPSVVLPRAPAADVVVAVCQAAAGEDGQTPGLSEGAGAETFAAALLRAAATATHPVVEAAQVTQAHERPLNVAPLRAPIKPQGEEPGARLVPPQVGVRVFRARAVTRPAPPKVVEEAGRATPSRPRVLVAAIAAVLVARGAVAAPAGRQARPWQVAGVLSLIPRRRHRLPFSGRGASSDPAPEQRAARPRRWAIFTLTRPHKGDEVRSTSGS